MEVRSPPSNLGLPRERLLRAAGDLLTRDGDFSTRTVCEAAGVRAPTLYHHFGDKEGLVEAAIAHAYASNLARKRTRAPSDDPVEDLRRGWNEHVEFAREQPGFYRLMYAVADAREDPPAPARAARTILMGEIRRIAKAGRLRVEPELAAEAIHTAVRGVGAMVSARQEVPGAGIVNDLVREAMLQALFADADGSRSDASADSHASAASHALALAELVPEAGGEFSSGEAALLQEWLRRIVAAE